MRADFSLYFRDPNSGYDGSSVEDAQLPFWDSYDPINQLYLEIGTNQPEPLLYSHRFVSCSLLCHDRTKYKKKFIG